MAASARNAPGGQSCANFAVPEVLRCVPNADVLVLAVAPGGMLRGVVVTPAPDVSYRNRVPVHVILVVFRSE